METNEECMENRNQCMGHVRRQTQAQILNQESESCQPDQNQNEHKTTKQADKSNINDQNPFKNGNDVKNGR